MQRRITLLKRESCVLLFVAAAVASCGAQGPPHSVPGHEEADAGDETGPGSGPRDRAPAADAAAGADSGLGSVADAAATSDGAAAAGTDRGTGDVAIWGDGSPALPRPAVAPDRITTNLSTDVATLNMGDNHDNKWTRIISISAGGGMMPGRTTNAPVVTVWKYKQPGAWLEYQVRAPKDGTFNVAAEYFADKPGGVADLLVNGMRAAAMVFSTYKEAGAYCGIPSSLSRSQGVPWTFKAGAVNKIRVIFRPDSAPVDVSAIETNWASAVLPDAGQVHPVSGSASTTLAAHTAADWFRTDGFNARSELWGVSHCTLNGYNLDVAKAGAYNVTVKYSTLATGCASAEYLLGGDVGLRAARVVGVRLPNGSGVSPPTRLQLPAGPVRLTVLNTALFPPNNGAYCGLATGYGEIVIKPAP